MSGWQRRTPLPRPVGSGTVALIARSMQGVTDVQKPFRGTYTVLVTPFTADGAAVDLKALERLVEFQIAEGIDGLIPLGSTGEFLSVSREGRNASTEWRG